MLYRKGLDHLMHQILTVSTTINPEKRPVVKVRIDPGWDPTADLFSGLIVAGTVKIWCTKRSGPYQYCCPTLAFLATNCDHIAVGLSFECSSMRKNICIYL